MNQPIIEIENLTKTFGSSQPALKNVTMKIPVGQITGIVGPDGSGKTTLLRLIVGILKPTSGSLKVRGLDSLKDAEEIRAFSSYMPQRFGLYEDLTVQENLDLYASLKNIGMEERVDIFAHLLNFTNLDPFKNRKAGNLSGGMKQKLGLACALLGKPDLLVLDEPSVGVDPISRRELWSIVQDLGKEGTSILWSTAYLDEAEKCAEVVLLNQGEVLYNGGPQELTKRVEGRVFMMKDDALHKRDHLLEIEKQPGIVDAVIQGDSIRIVHKESTFKGAELATPRLEDAFIDILGGRGENAVMWSESAPESTSEDRDLIIAESLVKKFGTFTAVDKISFEVHKGEIFGLLGPNGAGKSTTFKMLSGLLRPNEGKAVVDGYDLQVDPIQARLHMGYMAQKFSLYENLTVRQNLEFFAGVYTQSRNVDEKLRLFELEEVADMDTEFLPLGFKQRLSLAVATVHWPDILFLDEPTSGMDPVSRRHFWSEMSGLVKKGKTILVTTHFMEEAENCDRIGLVYNGRIINLDTPEKLKGLARDEALPNPTLEDTFIKLIREHDANKK